MKKSIFSNIFVYLFVVCFALFGVKSASADPTTVFVPANSLSMQCDYNTLGEDSGNGVVFSAKWCKRCSAAALATTDCSMDVDLVTGDCVYSGTNGAAISCNTGYSNLTENASPDGYCSPITYTITYNNMTNATNFSGAPSTYNIESATITFGTPTKTGYAFGGWYSDSGLTTPITQIPNGSTGNVVVYAKWTEIDINITYNYNDDNNTSVSDTCTYDAGFNLPDPGTREGYEFVGWTYVKE